MKLLNSLLLLGIDSQYVDYDRDVRMCTMSTSYVGPESFEFDLTNVFGKTAQVCPEETEMKPLYGSVPKWLEGHWFRTGPGKFSFGTDEYLGWADGLAYLQRMSFSNGKVTYKSDFQYGVHHVKNEAAGYIMYPEVATWGNPVECDQENDPDNQNLLNWLANDPDLVSDNGYVSFFSLGGGLYATGETLNMWRLDPVTLKGVEQINLDELFQNTMFKKNPTARCKSVASHLAHYHYDPDTDEFFGAFTCMTDHPVSPKIQYVFYSITEAGQNLKMNPEAPEAVWNRANIIAAIDSLHNAPAHLDYAQEYFHDFAITKNYLVFGLTNLNIDFLAMPQLMLNRQPLGAGAVWDADNDGRWFVMKRSSSTIQHIPLEFKSIPHFSTHTINAYEDEGQNKIIFDTTMADNNRQFGATFLANYTSTNEDLSRIYHYVSPLQTPVRFEFDLSDKSRATKLSPRPLHKQGHLPLGGADFPVINYAKNGKQNEYAFFAGFREVFAADSVYQMKIESGETICRFKHGYIPGEPRFIAQPGATSEIDGVVLVVWHPLVPTHPPLLDVLRPSDLGLVAQLEIPVDFLPAAIHGMFYTME